MDVIVKFLAGATIWIRAYVYNPLTDALADPTSITVTLVDADGTKQVDALSMTYADIGIYDYYYNTDSDSAEGWWNGEVWTIDGTGLNAKSSHESFSVEVRKGL